MSNQLSYEEYSSSKDFPAPPPTGTRYFTQSFIPTVPFTITSTGVYVGVKNTSDYIYYYIYLADANGQPTGDALVTVSDIWCASTGWKYGDVHTAYVILYPGISYCLKIFWGQGNLSLGFDTGYTNGKAWLYNGSSYVDQSGDFAFQLWGTAAAPAKATTPSPSDASITVTLDQSTISWVDGGGATSYDVYYGEFGEPQLVSAGQSGTSFTISGITYGSPFEYVISRTWRIDSINEAGTTTGDAWYFTTITYDPPQSSWVLITGGSGKGPNDTPPGVEGTDWKWTGVNFITAFKRLVAFANSKCWYEEL